jgi:oligogalacturonide transport system substrate-binding protein
MRKRIIAILTCCFILLGLCSCQTSNNKKKEASNVTIRFSWWGGESRHDKTMEVIQKFEEKYPDIKVKAEFAEWTGFNKKMSMKIAGNEEPDLMQINYDWIDTYSKDGKGFYDLNLVSDVLKLDNYSKEMLEYGTKNNVLNAIPISLNKEVVYYNKNLAEKYNIKNYNTWDELLNSRSKVIDENEYPLELDGTSGWTLPMAYVQEKNGKDFIKEDGTLGFNEEDLKELLTFYKTLVDKKITPITLKSGSYDLSDNKSISGFSWTSEAAKIQGVIEKNNNQVGIGKLPSVDGKGSLRYVKPSMLYAISKNTEHPKETALLLNFILNDEEAAKIQGFDRGVPASSAALKALESDGKLSGLQYEANKEDSSVKEVLISPYCENVLIKNICADALSKVAYGKVSVDECAKETYESLSRTLDAIKKH